MSTTRNNHYVPRWYQEGFFEPGRNTLAYLDMNPNQSTLQDGRIITEKSKFNAPTSRAFRQKDLYSTFFGASVNDEIERRLFGDIDTRGADAVRAFTTDDVGEWHRHFTTFFEYLDIQKIRTPKGLAWLSAQYPRLTQNELMFEMQGIRMMHCTIWTEGVREIVSAEDAEVKFIISDHPVTIFNHAVPPGAKLTSSPHDPSIALKGSQTIFPLNRDFCLILTNLEYAQDPSQAPLEKRTFAGNYRDSMVRTDAFIRTRKLTSDEVVRINRVLKARAHRYIAAGREEWLYPEASPTEPWDEIRSVFLPPKNELWHFGGEMYARFESGEVRYQDAFGRTEKRREFLHKEVPAKPLRATDPCGCGSGKPFGACCQPKPLALRQTWSERSIRERNIVLGRGISKMLGLEDGRDWATVRRELSDENIKQAYELYDALWPLQTRLLELLPKPDGAARAVYTGLVHPSAITEYALGASLYFDELLIQHPFIHPRTVKKEFSPTGNPRSFRQEFLKSVVLLLTAMPLVERGLVNLVPDPCDFDFHLRDQMLNMAQMRSEGVKMVPSEEPRFEQLAKEDAKRGMMLLPRDALRRQILQVSPELDETGLEEILKGLERLKERDPLAVLQEGSLDGGPEGGQFTLMKLAPNFEITMYLALATGACIVTDSVFRWREIKTAARRGMQGASPLQLFRNSIEEAEFVFLQDAGEIAAFADHELFLAYPALFRRVLSYLATLSTKEPKPNFEANLNAELVRGHESARRTARKFGALVTTGSVSCLSPRWGIQDNAVSRLLLMSSSEHHLANVPMALFLKGRGDRSADEHESRTV